MGYVMARHLKKLVILTEHNIESGVNRSAHLLEVLYSSVKRHYENGLQDFEMRDYVAKDLEKFSNWYGYDQIGRLISFVYQQVEKNDFK